MVSSTAPQPQPQVRTRTRTGKPKDPNSNGLQQQQQPAVRLKVVIRHLPSSLKESEFRDAMKDTLNDGTIDFFSWHPGKIFSDRSKPSTPSRCYVKVKDAFFIPALSNSLRLHGPFADSKGTTSVAQMEFSPYQKVPRKTQRADARAGTIDVDPDFQAFLASLMASSTPAAITETTVEGAAPAPTPQPVMDYNAPAPIPANDPLSVPMPSNEPIEKPKTTPLIEHIRAQKAVPVDKNISKGKAVERASAAEASSRGSRRADRRAREKAAKQLQILKVKVKEKADEQPTALLKRADNSTPRLARAGSSNLPTSSSMASAPRIIEKVKTEAEKDKPKERERRRGGGGASIVAGILQRDLGLASPNSRRSRARGTPPAQSTTAEPASPTTASTPTAPAANAASDSPVRATPKPRERPSRRERRAAKLEREESSASGTPSPPHAPAILRKQQSSNLSASTAASPPPPPLLMKRESSVTETPSTPTGPAADNKPVVNQTPTGPRGGGGFNLRGGGMRGGRGGRGVIAPTVHSPVAPPVAPPGPASGPPTGPAADRGVFRGRGRGGHFRGPRGRGGHGGVRGGAGAVAEGGGGE